MPNMLWNDQLDVRKFLSRVVAWPNPGEKAYITFHPTYQQKDWKKGDKFRLGHGAFVQDIEAGVGCAIGMFANEKYKDIYVCLGTQSETETVKWGKNGGTQEVAKRAYETTLREQSFRLDVDFKGGDHGYNSETEATLAVSKFVMDSGLPEPSIMVHSGNGLHIYWPLTTAISRDEWQPIAYTLQAATIALGLKNDVNVTVDACRILRVPGTLNCKYDPPLPVKLLRYEDATFSLEEIAAPLAKYKGLAKAVNVTSNMTMDFGLDVLKGASPFTAEIDHGLDTRKEEYEALISPKVAAKTCDFIATTMKNEGANLSVQTSWMHATHLATFMVRGREMAHLMARKNAYYSASDTDDLFDRKAGDKSRGVGWLKCKTIAGEVDAKPICTGCRHWKQDQTKYPFSFIEQEVLPPAIAATFVSVTPSGSNLFPATIGPPNYRQHPAGYWETTVDGDTVTPTTTRLENAYVMRKENEVTFFVDAHINSWDKVQLEIPASVIHSTPIELGKYLGGRGLAIGSRDDLKEMFVAWLSELIANRETYSTHAPYGWATDEKGSIIGFAFNKVLYSKGAPARVSGGKTKVLDMYKSMGDLKEWKIAVNGITDTKRPAIDAIIAAQFAGPLVRFTGENGIYMNVYSVDSGVGKSTALFVGQSVWGHPKKSMQMLNDTENSLFLKIAATRNITFNWDEIRGDQNKTKLASIVFNLTQGKEKGRMTPGADLREEGTWETMLVSCSNETMEGTILESTKGTEAGQLRVMELEAPKFGTAGYRKQSDAGEIKRIAETNYGVAGECYARWLGENYDKIQKDINDIGDEFEEQLKTGAEERYWRTAAVVLYLGATYANGLGLTNIDVKALKATMFARIKELQGDRSSAPQSTNSPEFVIMELARYLNDKRRHVMNTNKIFSGPKAPTDYIKLQHAVDEGRLINQDGFVAQIGHEDGLIRVLKDKFRDWLAEEGLNSNSVFKTFSSMGVITKRATIGAGLDLKSTYGTMLDIPRTIHPDLAHIMERVAQPTGANVVPINSAKGFSTP